MNKRGMELLWNIVLILIFVSFAGILIMWISGQATGKAIKADMIAKQTALMIDAAKPGTVIFIEAIVDIKDNKVLAESEGNKAEYAFFSKNQISISKTEGGTEIKIG